MSTNAPSDYFCNRDSPEDFQRVVSQSDHHALAQWCRDHPDQMSQALEWIHPHHHVLREIVRLAIEDRRFREVGARLKAIEKTHWTVVPVFVLALIAAIAAAIGAYFAGVAVLRPHPVDALAPQNSLSTPPPVKTP